MLSTNNQRSISLQRFCNGWAIAGLLTIVGLPLLSLSPRFVETFYSRGLYRWLTSVLSVASSWFSVSLSELTLYSFIIWLLVVIAYGVSQRRFKFALVLLGKSLVVALIWFYAGWGLHYFRLPLDVQLNLPAMMTRPDRAHFIANLNWSIRAANDHWRTIPSKSLAEFDHEIEAGYTRLLQKIDLPQPCGERRPKFLLVPALFDYTLTSGMFGPFFHEVHLSSSLLPFELPFVLAHEKAHQLGYAREDEANFLAALVCLTSPDSAVQYSGCFSLLVKFLNQTMILGAIDSTVARIRPEVLDDFAAVRERSARYAGAISDLAYDSYDLYLKANQIDEGIKNYVGVVDLMIRWRETHDWP